MKKVILPVILAICMVFTMTPFGGVETSYATYSLRVYLTGPFTVTIPTVGSSGNTASYHSEYEFDSYAQPTELQPTYKWSVGGEPTGVSINESSGVLTVTSDAVAGTITINVEVKFAEGEDGDTYAQGSKTETVTLKNENNSTPNRPFISTKTSDGLFQVYVPNDNKQMDYACVKMSDPQAESTELEWVSGTRDEDGNGMYYTSFDNLEPNTTYLVYARYSETNTTSASAKSKATVARTRREASAASYTYTYSGSYGQTVLEKAKTEAKAEVNAKIDANKYDDEEASEVKAILEQAEKDIAAAKTVEEVDKIKTEAETKIEAIPTAEEKADKAAVSSVTWKMFKATSKKTKLNGKKAVKITWSLPKGVTVDGFEVYRSTKKSSGYGTEPYFTTTKTSYTNNKDLKSGKTYYYKVRGYKMINGEKVYTGFSSKAWRTC